MTLNILQEKGIRGGVKYSYKNDNTPYERASLRPIKAIDTQRLINEKVMEMALTRI